MTPIITVADVSKTYGSGLRALDGISLDVAQGEIFALLGPNGAGKSTLIGLLCGIVKLVHGKVAIGGHDIVRDYRAARSLVGLVPQELTTDAFETVWNTVAFSRGLFGRSPNRAHIEATLKSLSLWEKRDSRIMTLSGGMKRRVMIAKALSHEPRVLFLDEPSAGVDVALRKDMWETIQNLRTSGVTIVLTTHYIEEAEKMADRVGVISHGRIICLEEKTSLMQRLGKKELTLQLVEPLFAIPPELSGFALSLDADGRELTYVYESRDLDHSVGHVLDRIRGAGIRVGDLWTRQSSLEEIFINLVRSDA